MTGKWDALIEDALHAEAELNANALQWLADHGYMALPQLLACLATALREAQAHVPPPRWMVTEYTREDGAWVNTNHNPHWMARDAKAKVVYANGIWRHPTAAAAMAAIEGSGK